MLALLRVLQCVSIVSSTCVLIADARLFCPMKRPRCVNGHDIDAEMLYRYIRFSILLAVDGCFIMAGLRR